MAQKSLLDYFNVKPVRQVEEKPSILEEIPFNERLQIARDKIKYLPRLKEKLYEKCREVGGCTPQILDDFYAIFEDEEILFLVSFFRRRIPNLESYYKRLGEEFYLIKRNRFTKVFLQCIEILDLVGDIQFIIRGSAGSSLVTYLLNITNIDPIKEKISLARFMSHTRKDMPDIDIDLPHNRREMIYERIFAKWRGRVARISNHVMFKSKTSLKEAVRQAGYRKFLPKDFRLQDIFEKEEDQNAIYENAAKLEGTFAHYSLHCGGIVIFDDIVPEKYYLQQFQIYRGKKGVTGAQVRLNKDEVETENLIKLDILSNRGLAQLADISSMLIEDYPDGDEKTQQLLATGENLGITFGESRGMRKIFMLMKPKCIYDVAVALALIRPSASMNNQKSDFLRDYTTILHECKSFRRENDIDYLIFDDDAIQYIARLLSITEGEADVYRKAFAKNRYQVKAQFICALKQAHPDFTEEKTEMIVQLLEQLQAYSFCKSHAISYAKLVWALAYQKAHNPKQFWLAALNNCNSSFRRWVHFREAHHSGIKLVTGRRPWRLNGDQLMCSGVQLKLKIDPVKDYWQYGYWTTPQFLPDMYAEYYNGVPQQPKRKPNPFLPTEQVPMVRFRGLVATGRPFNAERRMRNVRPTVLEGGEKIAIETGQKSFGRTITFFTVGVADGEYLDLVLWGQYPVGKIHCIEGEGMVKDMDTCKWIQVTTFRFGRI